MDRPMSFDVTDYYPEEDEWISNLVPPNDSMSGPSSPIKQNPDPEDDMAYVTITLDIEGDKIVSRVTDGWSSEEENPKSMLKKRNRPEKSVGYRRPRRTIFEAFEALQELKISISMSDAGWFDVENRYEKITAETGGLLIRSKFGECVGINSKEFALELFDMFARRLYIKEEVIDKTELWLFCERINDQEFDSRLKIFFEMADKDGDGSRLTEDEVREFIRLTASANNQSITKKMADEYAELIMDAFDHTDNGYITIKDIGWLLRDIEILKRLKRAKKSTKKWWKLQNLILRLKQIALI